MRLLAILALTAVALAGCGDDDEPLTAGDGAVGRVELAGEYRSVEVIEDGAPRPLVDGTTIALQFDDGQLGANAGCNHLGGEYELDGETLVVGMMGGTEMGCDRPRHAQDQWLIELLTSTPTVEASSDGFTLTAGTTTVRFVDREVADPDRPLVGTAWVVDGFVDGDTAMSTTAGTEASVRFAEDGTVHVDDGCNGLTWRYEVHGDTVSFAGGDGTDVGCESEEDQRRIRALFDAGTATVEIDAGHLRLSAPDGRGVTFSADP